MHAQARSIPGLAETWDHKFEAPHGSLGTLLSQAAARYCNHEAILSLHQPESGSCFHVMGEPDTRWTYRRLQLVSLKFAEALSSRGVTRHSSVVTFLFNQVEWCLAFWATMHLGCHFVPLDPRTLSQPEEARHLLEQTNVGALLIATSTLAAPLDAIMSKKPPVRCLMSQEDESEQLPEGWIAVSDAMTETSVDTHMCQGLQVNSQTPHDDPAVILYSSGTTSRPKACPQTSINLSAPATQLGQTLKLAPGHSVCQHLPSFHIFGLVFSLSAWLTGATVIFPSPSFDAESSIRAIEHSENVHMPCVPSMAQAVADHPSTPMGGFATLASIILGGAPCSPRIIDICKRMAPKQLCVGYGMTEGVVTLLNAKDTSAWEAVTGDISSGRACSGSRIKICEPGKRMPIGYGCVGELHQGGLPVFSGYLGIVDEELCYKQGVVDWLVTGDQAYMDKAGYIYILGRYKDIIIRGGENISPIKIENCLQKIPGISVRLS